MLEELAVVRSRERGLTERFNEVEGRMRAAEERPTEAVQPATDALRRIETHQIQILALRRALRRIKESLREERKVVAAEEDREGAEVKGVVATEEDRGGVEVREVVAAEEDRDGAKVREAAAAEGNRDGAVVKRAAAADEDSGDEGMQVGG